MAKKTLWGLLLMLLGIYMLLVNLGVISGSWWRFYIYYWPLLLIILGIAFLMPRHPLFIILLVILTILLPLLWPSFGGSPPPRPFHHMGPPVREQILRESWNPSLNEGVFELDLGQGILSIDRGSDLINVQARNYRGIRPHLTRETKDGRAYFHVQTQNPETGSKKEIIFTPPVMKMPNLRLT